jgi:malonate transporter and related proteins
MTNLLAIVVPVFGLIGLGNGAAGVRQLNPRGGSGFSAYVFVLAIAALIFQTLSHATLTEQQPWGYWIACFGAVALTWPLPLS